MKPDIKRHLILSLPYIIIWYLVDKVSWLYRMVPGDMAAKKIGNTFMCFTQAFSNPLPSFHIIDIMVGIVGALIIRFVVYYRSKNAKKFREGVEYGSARWGTPQDIKPYVDEEPDNNVILTQTEMLTMSSRPKVPKYARNKNILVIGGSGSGKTRFFVKPNLMQLHSSYCVTDPKGTILVECGHMLRKHGYQIKVLNTINFKKSHHYNPFMYIRSEKDILKLVNTIIANTKGEGDKSGEDFWVKAEKLYYQALIGYIWYEAPDEEKNFTTLLELINASEAREDDESFKNAVDLMFEDLAEREPDDIRTPLTSVIGYLNLLEEDPNMPPEQRAARVHIVLEKAYRLETMVNEFFEITKYKSQKITLSKETIDLYYMLVQLSDELSPVLAPRGNTVTLHLDENLTIEADPEKLARVFNNILKNAASYSFPHTEIVISAEKLEYEVIIRFQNSGEDIPNEALASVFNKFYRVDQSRSSDTGGTGLGLAIAKEIVTLHGGAISASSKNHVVTFTVSLPLSN